MNMSRSVYFKEWLARFKQGMSGAMCLPAITLDEVQVHVVACEEGAAVQRELHTARVGDGFTQQSHVAPNRG